MWRKKSEAPIGAPKRPGSAPKRPAVAPSPREAQASAPSGPIGSREVRCFDVEDLKSIVNVYYIII